MDKFIKPLLGYNRMVLLDNASDLKYLKKLGCTVFNEDLKCEWVGRMDLFAVRFNEHLPRTSHLGYSYWWRAIYKIPELQKHMFFNSEKWLHIDSDLYIQTNEFIDYLKGLDKGFVSFWNVVHNFPTSELFFIHTDSMYILEEDSKKGIDRNVEAENALPWTHVEKKFLGGRFGDIGQLNDKDHFVGQVVRGYPVKFKD
jgi:hypothetical protein